MIRFLLGLILLLPVLSGEEPYRLTSGDLIELKYFYNPELNDSVQIRPDGRVSFPLIGEVQLSGKSIAEATDELKKLYAPILKTPVVNINVRQFAGQKVFVGGEVLRPGSVAMPGSMTLLEAVAEAGGPKATASRSTVILIRKGPDGTPVRQVLALKEGKAPAGAVSPAAAMMLTTSAAAAAPVSSAAAITLKPFDVVILPESRIARADRWIDQHIRQIIPANLTAGFSYLWNPITVR